MSLRDRTAGLPAPLVGLLEEQGLRPLCHRLITRLPSPASARRSYLIELTNGGKLKGRLLETAQQAEQFARLSGCLEGLPFGRVIKQHGNAVLEQWLPGVEFPGGPVDASRSAEAGEILGRLHCLERQAAKISGEDRATAAYIDRTSSCLERLVSARQLTDSEARSLLADAVENRPALFPRGLIHLDFCGENMVLSNGEIWLIDNEMLEIGPLDADLARTWYRWPELDRSAFLSGYRRFRACDGFVAHSRFWQIVTVVKAVDYRLSIGAPVNGILQQIVCAH